jgi:hypothetical protein
MRRHTTLREPIFLCMIPACKREMQEENLPCARLMLSNVYCSYRYLACGVAEHQDPASAVLHGRATVDRRGPNASSRGSHRCVPLFFSLRPGPGAAVMSYLVIRDQNDCKDVSTA